MCVTCAMCGWRTRAEEGEKDAMDDQAGYRFFQHRGCEFFPCHEGVEEGQFSCLFCYCPLYCLGDKCGGAFRYTESGIKDCSACLRPHRRENYNAICGKMSEVLELVRRK